MKIIIVGICILFLFLSLMSGLLIFKYKKDVKKTETFINSSSLVFFILLIIFYFLPNCLSLLENEFNVVQCYAYLFLMILLGMMILKFIMYFMSNKNSEFKNSLNISILSLLIVFIEGIYIYSIKNNTSDLLFLTVRYLIYNVLLSLSIIISYRKSKVNLMSCVKYLFIILAIFMVGFLLSFNGNFIFKDNLWLGSLVGIVIGMLIYLITYVYIPYFKQDNESKIKTYALIITSVIMVLVNML